MHVTVSTPRGLTVLAAAVLALLGSLAFARPAAAQANGSLAGRVTSAAGAPVGEAAVVATAAGGRARRARTGADGAWRIARLAPGAYTVRITRVGFTSAERAVEVAAGAEARADVALAESDVALAPVQAVGRRDAERERTRFESEAGVTTRVITGAEIKILPGLGEADVMRAVEVLPGVVTTSDFSTAFNVRGGSSDQNLVLLDGFPIFNPFHLGGLFSVFNSDAIARAELLSGGFGAEYGGRVSSVLNIESKPGGGDEGFGGEAGVSLLSSRVSLHGNLPRGVRRMLGGDAGGWLVSVRRSYFDVVLKPVVDFPYHLTDLQGTATIATRGGGRLRLVAYGGQDVLDLRDFTPPGIDTTDTSILRIRWNWGNRVAGVRLEQPLGQWVTTSSLGVSHYGESLGFVDFSDTRFSSTVTQLTARAEAGRPLGERLTMKAGGELTRLGYHNVGEAGGTTFFSGDRSGVMTGGFGQLRWSPNAAWILEPGVRVDAWHSGTTRAYVAPRFAVKRFFGARRDGAVKLAAGRYVQFVHSLRDEQLPVSNDYWVTADEHVPAVISDQAQLGIEKYWGEQWYASAETYYRRYLGVTDLNSADDPNDPADDLLEGRGYSYGADLMVRRTQGRLRGWMTLSLLRAERTFPDPLRLGLDGVPETITFPPVFDRRVDLDVVGEYLLPGKIEAGMRLNFGSGVPYSRPVAAYVGFETDLANGGYRIPRPIGKDPQIPIYVVPGDRNRQRYPAYSRLDLTFRRSYAKRWGTLTPYAQVLNATNRRNVLFYFYNYDQNPPTRSGVSMFPVLPTIGLEATF
ncbi:MAG TPA: TonB-dependent receptor [Longimicrobium sp.]|nr:TonB-dependent receptor [Longimicrobium sp.]